MGISTAGKKQLKNGPVHGSKLVHVVLEAEGAGLALGGLVAVGVGALDDVDHLAGEALLEAAADAALGGGDEPHEAVVGALLLAEGGGDVDDLGAVGVGHGLDGGRREEDGLAEDGEGRGAGEGEDVGERVGDDAARFGALAVFHDQRSQKLEERVLGRGDVDERLVAGPAAVAGEGREVHPRLVRFVVLLRDPVEVVD
jgi:hypothetical protein